MDDGFSHAFEEGPERVLPATPVEQDSLVVDVGAYEGPLDVLLALARTQKVDLRMISVLALAVQYLHFVESAKRLRIELAADYLVMAAWLAFLKSRLLLPSDDDGQPDGEELAAHLAFQLQRLEAMRRSGANLMARDQLGREFHPRGMPETMTCHRQVEYHATQLDLMQAYARVRTRDSFLPLNVARDSVLTVEQALERLRPLIRTALEWGDLRRFLPEAWLADPKKRRSATAATFAATLELAKLGQLELRQFESFAPIEVRYRSSANG